MRSVLFALVLCVGLITSASAQSERRVALVFYNGDYQAVPTLSNPARDGALVAESLRRAGFASVELIGDQTKSEMDAALRAFRREADTADVAVIYFAGHGIEVDNQNWLLPTDAFLEDPADIYTEGVSLDVLLRHVAGASRLRMVLLDACRENPFAMRLATRSIPRGLRPVDNVPVGTVIAFSAAAGQLAADGDAGGNGPFALALSRRLAQPGVELNLMLRQVRDDVVASSPGGQEPWISASLSAEPFYFVPGAQDRRQDAASTPRTTRSSAADLDALAWQGAVTANTAAAYRLYLDQHPSGRFAGLAQENLTRLADNVSTRQSQRGGPAEVPIAQQRPPMEFCDALKAIMAAAPSFDSIRGPAVTYLTGVHTLAIQSPAFDECQLNLGGGFMPAYATCDREYPSVTERDADMESKIVALQACFRDEQYARTRRWNDDDGDLNFEVALASGFRFRLLRWTSAGDEQVALFASPPS